MALEWKVELVAVAVMFSSLGFAVISGADIEEIRDALLVQPTIQIDEPRPDPVESVTSVSSVPDSEPDRGLPRLTGDDDR